jgi:hypothetical protein
MKKLFLCALLFAPILAQAQLEWRISIKVFTGAGGAQPRLPVWALGGTNLLQELTNGVLYANSVLDSTGRGYRWRLQEILTLAGTTTPGPASTNSWFNLVVNPATQNDLDGKAKANAGAFLYRDNAINFYYVDNNSGPNGGYCAGPSENEHVITIAPNSFADVLLHEAGHFFALQHTHNTEQFRDDSNSLCNSNPPCTCARLIGGDDGIADTPVDNECWSRDRIAQNAFGQNYTNLNGGQQFFVDNTWLNVMSYHSPGIRFTDDQLDVMADNSNAGRITVATGRTRFVNRFGNAGNQQGTSAQPFVTVLGGVNAAIDGDIVLIRTGNYNEPRTYTKPVTFRATRGEVNIGLP